MNAFFQKRGQIQSLAPAILALVFAGILLVLGLVITSEMSDIKTLTDVHSATAYNETLATVTETGEIVTRSSAPAFSQLTVLKAYVTNASGNYSIASANYSVKDTNTIYYADASESLFVNNTDWLVSYTYVYGDEAWKSANNTVVGLGTFADFWEIIVLAIVTTVVIGLLLVVFGRKKTR